MSGGIAYLLDPDPGLINAQSADLEPLGDAGRAAILRELHRPLSREHLLAGGGAAARRLAGAIGRLRRVMPRDYKRVLAATTRAEQDGIDVAEAVMAAVRA